VSHAAPPAAAAVGVSAEVDDDLVQRLGSQAPPSGAARRRFYSRTTEDALKDQRAHQHKGAHPYRVILGEVRENLGEKGRGWEIPS
jgi:hypothetical protein